MAFRWAAASARRFAGERTSLAGTPPGFEHRHVGEEADVLEGSGDAGTGDDVRRPAATVPDSERSCCAEQPAGDQPGPAPAPHLRLASGQPIEHFLLHVRPACRSVRHAGQIGRVGHGARPCPTGRHLRLQRIANGLGLREVALDRQHVGAVGTDHPPLARHLIDRQFGPEVAAEPLRGAGEREPVARDHSPLHYRQPEPVNVYCRRGEEQAGEQPDADRRPKRASRERPFQPAALEPHRPTRGRVDTTDRVEGGRLAGAVGADDRDDAPRRACQIEFRHRHQTAKPDRHPIQVEQRQTSRVTERRAGGRRR